MKKMGVGAKVAAYVNRKASGAAPGRKETESRAVMRASRNPESTMPYKAPNGMGAGHKASGPIGRAIDRRVERGMKKAGV
ncbi:MAG TPA: hypothetical protein VFH85_07715 [Gammaproteobacteria bacterium]|nr:hypothetical protein [Gammaproteobacteria bacterium]